MTTWCAEDTTSLVPGRYAYPVIDSITGIGILLLGTGRDTVNRQSKLIEGLFTYKLKQLADKQRRHG